MVSSTDFVRASERTTAIATLNRQRHLTPSCGGFTPTAERTVGPARMIVESLTARPGIREQNRPEADIHRRIVGRVEARRPYSPSERRAKVGPRACGTVRWALASSAELPLVTAQTVAFGRGVGGRTFSEQHGGQSSSRLTSNVTLPLRHLHQQRSSLRVFACLQGTRRKGNVKVRKPGISGNPSAASTDTKARTAAGTSPLTSRLIAVA